MNVHSEFAIHLCIESVENKQISMAEAYDRGWNFEFRRRMADGELIEWREMAAQFAEVELTDHRDKMLWKLASSGKFTTKSVYMYLLDGGMVDKEGQEIWRVCLPLKIKIFI
ncbi:hypothetical protein BS78_09G125500 [Paspalum vaginatum]|nr:hypothetical protein BS78_09G125500 [Paspalum vaginatum]